MDANEHVEPTLAQAVTRGAMCRCPRCGQGQLFKSYLKVADTCPVCREELLHQRADDLPAYVVAFIVGHIVVGLLLWLEMNYTPPFWVHAAIEFPLTIVLALALLPVVKGMTVGLQWSLGMHGFAQRHRGLSPAPVIAS